ncbi:Fc receptor-like protein 3 isoform X2 [Rhinolophus ferrumequinum]|uniref:Fc receptor like 3 n=1 Tax=Rhinolophus ferrumequinum TaxID=59479 RepID=A0A671FEK8_RHIFE|nr:Fc receptor-like protein 3 isoform X2 [Rhinolophus ferrumequinum]
MLLWLLLVLTPGRGQSGLDPKASLLLEPPWSTTFKGQTVTLICRGPRSPAQGDVSWYHDEHLLKTNSEEIHIKTSGYYKCKTHGSSISDPVYVKFLSEWLVLQAQHPVFEGDNVTLRCQGKDDETVKEKSYYRNGKKLGGTNNSGTIIVYSASRDNSIYYCTASGKKFWGPWTETSNHLRIHVQELFPRPLLRASPFQPTEGSPVNLTCETRLPPQRSDVQLQFCFFREGQALGSGCSSSPELRIPAMWSEDARSYWCQAQTVTLSVKKKSLRSYIRVRRVPVSGVNLEIQPRGGKLIEGENLILVCSVAKGTGTVTFSWHREGTQRSLGRKTQRSLSAELQVPSVKAHDAGKYYCAADNVQGPVLSQRLRVTLAVPASRPVLTLRAPGAPALVGDTVELHCEAQTGSPPILYHFYHDGVTLGNSSAPSGGGVSFNLSLTEEHSGNYSCEADNGVGAQRSYRVILSVTVPASRPVLTLRATGAPALVGDTVELHCEAQTGSPPILYRFYHDGVTLGSSSAPSGGGVSFNLSLTAEHSGNYSCEADNGVGAQRSEVVTFNVTGTSVSKVTITAGVIGLLSVLGLAATATWVSRFRTQRNSGGLSATGTPSCGPTVGQGPSSSHTRGPSCSEPALMELQPVYGNVGPGHGDLIYSQVSSIQRSKGNPENSPRMHQEDKEPVVIYSELKKGRPDHCAGQASSGGRAREEASENYENVSCALSAMEH